MLKKLFVLLSFLPVILLSGGCSDAGTAEKRLANELKSFVDRYVQHEFAKQLKLNDQCKAFRVDDNKLLLIGFDGIDVVQRTVNHNDLHEFAVARYYVGQELSVTCHEAAWSNLTAVDHERFSYRASVTLKFTDTRRMWQRGPGCSIVLTAFKNKLSPDAARNELLNNAAGHLPDERFDYKAVYSRTPVIQSRKFSVSFFVCYDPSLPGWVPEDAALFSDTKVNAVAPDWLDLTPDKYKIAGKLALYKNDFYWLNSKVIRENYDNGLVFYANQWMPLAQACESIKLEDVVNKFDPHKSSIENLTLFMHNLNSFSGDMDFSKAVQKAVLCAEKHINAMRMGNKWQDLERFYSLVQENPDYSRIVDQLKENLQHAISAVKQRINRSLDEAIDRIKASQQTVQKMKGSTELTATQINIECVRQENVLTELCPQDSKIISQQIFQLRFLLLLMKNDIPAVNKLYKITEKKKLLFELEKNVVADCKTCRKGLQKCIYCEKNPGKCSDCNGIMPDGGEKCSSCQNSGVCVHCRGVRTMKCMNCRGRGFIILHSKVNELCKNIFSALENILQNNIKDLESKKLL